MATIQYNDYTTIPNGVSLHRQIDSFLKMPVIVLNIYNQSNFEFLNIFFWGVLYTVEPRFNKAIGTVKFALLHQVSCIIMVKKHTKDLI